LTPLEREGAVSMEWPEWWECEIFLSAHVELRMELRDFTEIDLRQMLRTASGYEKDVLEGLVDQGKSSTTQVGCDRRTTDELSPLAA
jgi:hypothetical protein